MLGYLTNKGVAALLFFVCLFFNVSTLDISVSTCKNAHFYTLDFHQGL